MKNLAKTLMIVGVVGAFSSNAFAVNHNILWGPSADTNNTIANAETNFVASTFDGFKTQESEKSNFNSGPLLLNAPFAGISR